jgi:hypothetical protein
MLSCFGQIPSGLFGDSLSSSRGSTTGTSCGGINDLVDAQNREGVFRTVTVEIGVVNTHAPLAGFLGVRG